MTGTQTSNSSAAYTGKSAKRHFTCLPAQHKKILMSLEDSHVGDRIMLVK